MTYRSTTLLWGTLLLSACGFPKTTDTPPALPDTSSASSQEQQSIVRGRASFVAGCNGCHGYPDVAGIGSDRWPAIMSEMGPKAKLSAEASQDVLHFVLASRQASSPQ